MAYIPNASDATQPTGDVKASTAAAEFRTLKTRVNAIAVGNVFVPSATQYGADPTGVADSTAAINTMIAANPYSEIPYGVYRIDGTVVCASSYTNPKRVLMQGAQLIRKSANSAATTPVLQVIGSYSLFDCGNGTVTSQNDSPSGVVCLGHADALTSNYNAVHWNFRNALVETKIYATAPATLQAIGVYIPSSQPFLGSSFVNYFGHVSNVNVQNASTAWYLTDLVNGCVFNDCTANGFWYNDWALVGAYGNTFYGGFSELGYRSGVVSINLGNKIYPAAPFASSLQSMFNHFHGITMELYLTGQFGVVIAAGCQGNYVEYAWNSVGTALSDADGFNTIIESRLAKFTTIQARTTIGVGATSPATTGAGITFPAVQAPSANVNTLDDYSEGTFVPTIVGSTVAGVGTYSTQTGYYTKIGNLVTVAIAVNWSAHTGTGNMSVAGLPYTPAALPGVEFIAVPELSRAVLPAGTTPLAIVVASVARAGLYSQTVGTGSAAALALDADAAVYFSLTYMAV